MTTWAWEVAVSTVVSIDTPSTGVLGEGPSYTPRAVLELFVPIRCLPSKFLKKLRFLGLVRSIIAITQTKI